MNFGFAQDISFVEASVAPAIDVFKAIAMEIQSFQPIRKILARIAKAGMKLCISGVSVGCVDGSKSLQWYRFRAQVDGSSYGVGQI